MEDYFYDDFEAPPMGSSKMASAALVLAFLSIPLISLFYLAIPIAALAIILALLSRGKYRLAARSKLAVMISCAAITISCINTTYLLYRIHTSPALRMRLENMIQQIYEGYSSDSYPEADPQSIPQNIPENIPLSDGEGGALI